VANDFRYLKHALTLHCAKAKAVRPEQNLSAARVASMVDPTNVEYFTNLHFQQTTVACTPHGATEKGKPAWEFGLNAHAPTIYKAKKPLD
jgi:hypothetical protein